MSRVVGADLSLASTGLALAEQGRPTKVANIKSKGKRSDGYPEHVVRIERMSKDIIDQLQRWLLGGPIDLIVIESPSHGSKFGNPHERAAIWWDVYRWAYGFGIPVATVAPQTRAKYITGDGRSKKDVVVAHAIHYYADFVEIPNDDVADALGLAAMGSRYLGEPVEVELPEANLAAMDGVLWPTT